MKLILFTFVCLNLFNIILTGYILCPPKNAKIVNFKSRLYRHIPHTVSCTVEKCLGVSTVYYSWMLIREIDSKIFKNFRGPSFKIVGYDIPISVVFAFEFRLLVVVSHNSALMNATMAEDKLRFLPSDLVLKFVGGPKVYHHANSDLTLDVTGSYDKSFSDSEYTWTHYRETWSVSPHVSFDRTDDPLKVTVRGKLLKAPKEYKFTITMKRYLRGYGYSTWTESQIVKIISSVLEIKCVQNCRHPITTEETLVTVLCLKYCEGITFKWTVHPKVDLNATEFGNSSDKFLVKKDVFKPGALVTFTTETISAKVTFPLKFKPALPPFTCDVNPKYGLSAFTIFEVLCSTKEEVEGYIVISQFYSEEKYEVVLVGNGHFNKRNHFYLSAGNPAQVPVYIRSKYFVQRITTFTVRVIPFMNNLTNYINFIEDVLYGDMRLSFKKIIKSSDIDLLAQTINCLAPEVQKMDNKKEVNHINKHFAQSLTAIKAEIYSRIHQKLTIAQKILYHYIYNDTVTARLISTTVQETSKNLLLFSDNDYLEIPIPVSFLQRLCDIMFNINHLLLISSRQLSRSFGDQDVYLILSESVRVPHVEFFINSKNITANFLMILTNIGDILLRRRLVGQELESITKKHLEFSYHKMSGREFGKHTLRIANRAKIRFHGLRFELENFEEISYHYSLIDSSLFWWYRKSKHSNDGFLLLNINHVYRPIISGNYVELMFRPEDRYRITIRGLLKPGRKNIRIYRIKMIPHTTIVATFNYLDRSYLVTWTKCYCEYGDFYKGITIQKHGSTEQRTILQVASTEIEYNYLCLLNDGSETLYYSAGIFSISCEIFEPIFQTWKSDLCTHKLVSVLSRYFVCDCNHTSLYTFSVIPATIYEVDPPEMVTFDIESTHNWFMILFVVSILAVYILIMIWGVFVDRKREKLNKVCILEDNIPGDSHVYAVIVFTGFYLDAGTTSNVCMQLIGDRSKSRVHLIKPKCTGFFGRNSQDWMIIFTPYVLGKVVAVRFWHDCAGNRPHWFCDRVIVLDFKTGDQYCFFARKWLSLIWGDGTIYKEFKLYDKEDNPQWWSVLRVRLITGLKNNHYLLRIFTRDLQSNVSTKEGMSVFFSSLFLSMVIITYIESKPTGTVIDSIDTKFRFRVTWRDIVMYAMTSVIVIFSTTVLWLLFEKSKPRKKASLYERKAMMIARKLAELREKQKLRERKREEKKRKKHISITREREGSIRSTDTEGKRNSIER